MEAVEAGSFSIYPVETIDQAVTLLLGQSMDEVDRLVSVRLQKWKNHKTRADKRKDES
jgi:predicted ATP-dependent protease